MRLKLPLALLSALLCCYSSQALSAEDKTHHWTTDTSLTESWEGTDGFTLDPGVTLTTSSTLTSGVVHLEAGSKLIINQGDLLTSAYSALTWFYAKSGSTIEMIGDKATWNHQYYVSISEDAVFNMSAGAKANISYIAFGGTSTLTGEGTVLTLGGYPSNVQGYFIQSAFGGSNTTSNSLMTVGSGATIDAKNGIALGHRSDASVSKDASLTIANGGKLIIAKSLNIGAGRFNNNQNDSSSGNGTFTIQSGGIADVEALKIGTGISKYPSANGIAKGTINIEREGILNLTSQTTINLGAGATISNRGTITGITSYSLVAGSALYLGEFILDSGVTNLGLNEKMTITSTGEKKAIVGTNLTNTTDTVITLKHGDVIKSIEAAYKDVLTDTTYAYLLFGKFKIDYNTTTDTGSVGGIGEGSTVDVIGDSSSLSDGVYS